jgi:hypothetical protein
MPTPDQYYNWDGQPITPLEFFTILRTRGREIADDTIGGYRVSTVWLGYRPHNVPFTVTPLIFETIVFAPVELRDDVYWYATLEEALSGHARACMRVAGLEQPEGQPS